MEVVCESMFEPKTPTQTDFSCEELVEITNALLMFAAGHCYYDSIPKMILTWNTPDSIRNVKIEWTLKKPTHSRDLDLYQWGDQCIDLKKCLQPHFDARSMNLHDDWTKSEATIIKTEKAIELAKNATTPFRGDLDGSDLVAKINGLLEFTARCCHEDCKPRIEVLWTGPSAKKEILFFWSMEPTDLSASLMCYNCHDTTKRLRECLAPDFYAYVSYCDDLIKARASITHDLPDHLFWDD